jgi:hypothetical protein
LEWYLNIHYRVVQTFLLVNCGCVPTFIKCEKSSAEKEVNDLQDHKMDDFKKVLNKSKLVRETDPENKIVKGSNKSVKVSPQRKTGSPAINVWLDEKFKKKASKGQKTPEKKGLIKFK